MEGVCGGGGAKKNEGCNAEPVFESIYLLSIYLLAMKYTCDEGVTACYYLFVYLSELSNYQTPPPPPPPPPPPFLLSPWYHISPICLSVYLSTP